MKQRVLVTGPGVTYYPQYRLFGIWWVYQKQVRDHYDGPRKKIDVWFADEKSALEFLDKQYYDKKKPPVCWIPWKKPE